MPHVAQKTKNENDEGTLARRLDSLDSQPAERRSAARPSNNKYVSRARNSFTYHVRMCQAKIRTPCFPCLLPHGWCGALSLAACLQNVTHGVEERGRCSLTHCSHRMSKDRRLSDNQRQDMTRPARTRTQQFNRGIESNESIISMA